MRNLLWRLQARSSKALKILDKGVEEKGRLPEILGGSDIARLQRKGTSIPGFFLESRAASTMNKQPCKSSQLVPLMTAGLSQTFDCFSSVFSVEEL